MKKHPLRDCAVEAFRQYAKNEIHKIEHNVSDKIAMEKTFDAISHKYGNYAINVLKQVYFVRPSTPIKSGEIHNRVIRASIENYIGEATVYRILRTARNTFIKYRYGEIFEVLPCPFCNKKLIHISGKEVNQYYRKEPTIYKHFPEGCVLDGLQITEKTLGKWNTRMQHMA